MNNIDVIIIGTTHHNTYSMIRCFGEYGKAPVLVLYGDNHSYIAHSKLVKECVTVLDEKAAINYLVSSYRNPKKALIIPCSDTIASEIDKSYNILINKYYIFNCGSQGELTFNMNKFRQNSVAHESGLRVPLSQEGMIKELKECDIPYPRIVKPVESIHGGKKIDICYDNNEYCDAIRSYNENDKALVQEYILKEYEIVVLGARIKEKTLIPGFIQKHRDILGGTTFSTVRNAIKLPAEVLSSCKKLVDSINYEGLFGIELIKNKNGYYFVEINLRNDATTYAMAVAGVNLPFRYYEIVTGQESVLTKNTIVDEIDAMVELTDVIHIFKGNISILKWLSQKRKSRCRFCYSEMDKKVYWLQICKFLRFVYSIFLEKCHVR